MSKIYFVQKFRRETNRKRKSSLDVNSRYMPFVRNAYYNFRRGGLSPTVARFYIYKLIQAGRHHDGNW